MNKEIGETGDGFPVSLLFTFYFSLLSAGG